MAFASSTPFAATTAAAAQSVALFLLPHCGHRPPGNSTPCHGPSVTELLQSCLMVESRCADRNRSPHRKGEEKTARAHTHTPG